MSIQGVRNVFYFLRPCMHEYSKHAGSQKNNNWLSVPWLGCLLSFLSLVSLSLDSLHLDALSLETPITYVPVFLFFILLSCLIRDSVTRFFLYIFSLQKKKLTHLGPWLTCWSNFGYGLDFAEKFESKARTFYSAVSMTPRSLTICENTLAYA